MKNNTFFKLFIIFLIAFLFRLWFIDKPEGLWNDEYVSWFIASKKDFTDFLTEMFRNCHAPLYYIYLKFWMFLFKDSDISLRISSVIPSLLTIIIMFFIGKETKNIKLGMLCSFLTAINSFHIYFAQEVRLYSLLMLLCSLTLLFFIKLEKKQNAFNFIIFFCTNALICATHTLGIIFSLINITTLLILLYKENKFFKEKTKNLIIILKYISPFILVVLLILPFLFTVAFSQSLSQFWSNFSISKILFCIVDYFSPIQTNIVNVPDTIFAYILKDGNINYIFIIFAILPSIIGLIGIYRGLKEKNTTINYYFISAFLFFISLIILSILGKIILITKYSCEIYPILILIFALGLSSFKKESIKIVLTSIFIILNIFYLITSTDSAPKRTRSEGHLAVVQLLENSRLKNKDYVLLTYYDKDKFERYLNRNTRYNFYSINKFNFNYFMFNNNNYYETINKGKTIYRNYFKEFPNEIIIKYVNENFNSKMKKGDRIGIIFLNTVSFLSNDKIQNIVNDNKEYDRTPFIFLSFSALKNSILYAFKDNYRIDSITQAGDWTLFVFEKTEI